MSIEDNYAKKRLYEQALAVSKMKEIQNTQASLTGALAQTGLTASGNVTLHEMVRRLEDHSRENNDRRVAALKETREARRLLGRSQTQLARLLAAVNKDLKAIRVANREACGDCGCDEMPAVDCPNNKLAATMSAVLEAALSSIEGDKPTQEAADPLFYDTPSAVNWPR